MHISEPGMEICGYIISLDIFDRKMECISVGGGSNNACFWVIADLCGRQILAGPSGSLLIR